MKLWASLVWSADALLGSILESMGPCHGPWIVPSSTTPGRIDTSPAAYRLEEQLAASLGMLQVPIDPGELSLCTANHFQATIVNKTIEKTVLAK
jgi:hypothetical protein